MRFKKYVIPLLNEETLEYYNPNIIPRIIHKIFKLYGYRVVIKETEYNLSDISDIENNIFYVTDIIYNKNSYGEEVQIISKNITQFNVPSNGKFSYPDAINVPYNLYEKIQSYIKRKGLEKIYKMDIYGFEEYNNKSNEIKINDLPIYGQGTELYFLEKIK